jgi:hypothetical protein
MYFVQRKYACINTYHHAINCEKKENEGGEEERKNEV